MASPWKFLARLMSPQRLQKQEESADEGATDEGVKANDIDARGRADGHDLADQPAEDAPPPVNRSDAVSVEPSRSDESGSHAAESGEGSSQQRQVDPAQVMAGAGGQLADTELENSAPAPAKRNRRVKKVDAVAGGAEIPPAAQSATDKMTSVDDEIRQLRFQLAHKLRLQNAQLKKMLERFER